MPERSLNGIWNAERVLQNLLRFTDDRGEIRILNLSDDSPYGIEVRRFVAAMECSSTIAIAIKATENLNQTQIKAVCNIVDRMLVLLMGDDFGKSFIEEELLPFGYPNVTDEELEDMILDNW